MRSRLDTPENATGNTLVIVPNGPGETCEYLDGSPGDTVVRARSIVEALGSYGIRAGSVSFDRISPLDSVRKRTFIMGLSKALETGDYMRMYIDQAQELDQVIERIAPDQVVALGSTAGAQHLLHLLPQLRRRPDVVSLWDPTGVWKHKTSQFNRQMLVNQARSTLNRPASAGTGDAAIGLFEDMALMRRLWAGDSASPSLMNLALGRYEGVRRAQVVFPGGGLIADPAESHALTDAFNAFSQANRHGTSNALFQPDLHTSFVSNPAACGQLVLSAMGLEQLQ